MCGPREAGEEVEPGAVEAGTVQHNAPLEHKVRGEQGVRGERKVRVEQEARVERKAQCGRRVAGRRLQFTPEVSSADEEDDGATRPIAGLGPVGAAVQLNEASRKRQITGDVDCNGMHRLDDGAHAKAQHTGASEAGSAAPLLTLKAWTETRLRLFAALRVLCRGDAEGRGVSGMRVGGAVRHLYGIELPTDRVRTNLNVLVEYGIVRRRSKGKYHYSVVEPVPATVLAAFCAFSTQRGVDLTVADACDPSTLVGGCGGASFTGVDSAAAGVACAAVGTTAGTASGVALGTAAGKAAGKAAGGVSNSAAACATGSASASAFVTTACASGDVLKAVNQNGGGGGGGGVGRGGGGGGDDQAVLVKRKRADERGPVLGFGDSVLEHLKQLEARVLQQGERIAALTRDVADSREAGRRAAAEFTLFRIQTARKIAIMTRQHCLLQKQRLNARGDQCAPLAKSTHTVLLRTDVYCSHRASAQGVEQLALHNATM